jgi:CubicO group peptidase (beta-lactamase class C family)/Flp pilus assembly protein TadD
MTAVAIMQLVEKGKVNLDAEVQTYVPYFPKKQWPVTVRHVLGHLGGISHYKNPTQELHIKDRKSTREAIAIFENFDLVAEPGTRYSYSSYGYNLLGAIIEAASGMSYGEYMRQHIWQPLGMTDTQMDDPLEVIPNRVRGYQLINGKIKNSEFVDISSRFAAGGTRSTVPDLLKFAKGFIEGKLLSEKQTQLVGTSMQTKSGMLTDYGMGWQTEPQNGRYTIAHSGGQQETRTFLYVFPTQRLAFAAAVNGEGGNPFAYIERLFQLINGEQPVTPGYSNDKSRNAAYNSIDAAFNYGLGYFDQTGQPLTSDPNELAAAFADFKRLVALDVLAVAAPETLRKIREGVHPVGSRAFTKIGSYMAQRLKEKYGPARLASYPGGSLNFFQDYITLSSSDSGIPKEHRFDQPFVSLVSEMARDWNRTNSPFVKQLRLMANDDLDQVGATLRRTFQGATVYPSFADPLFGVARQLLLKGDHTRALKASRLAADLYPETPSANLIHGIALVFSADIENAKVFLKKSAMLNPTGGASAGGLNNVAYQLAGAGMVDHGLAVLRIAIDIYPQEANLHDSLGEFLLRKGEKAKALESYRKALELNPNFGNSTRAREVVQKLTAELGAQKQP